MPKCLEYLLDHFDGNFPPDIVYFLKPFKNTFPYPFKKVLLHTFPFSCFILSNSLCCALIFASNSDSRLRISAWSRRFSSSRSARMDFCCCINVVFPVPVFPPLLTALAIVLLPDVFSLLFTQSFSSPDLPGDRLGERLVRLPGLRLFLLKKWTKSSSN